MTDNDNTQDSAAIERLRLTDFPPLDWKYGWHYGDYGSPNPGHWMPLPEPRVDLTAYPFGGLQILNGQVFGDGLPMFPPHLCCCGTSAIGRAFAHSEEHSRSGASHE